MTSKINYDEIINLQPTINIGCLGSVTDGKCFARGTLIKMFDQPDKAVEEVQVGDCIMGNDFTKRMVVSTTSGQDQMYEIQQKIGENYTVNSHHILCLMNQNTGNEFLINTQDFFELDDNKKKNLFGFKNKKGYQNLISDIYQISIQKKNIDNYYGFTIDGNNLFLLADGTVTHNSSMVNTVCNQRTQKHSSEHIKNITIKLGYANAKIFKCSNCPEPECYESFGSHVKKAFCTSCPGKEEMKLIRHISFVDCPGHNDLLLTMLSGVGVMDHSIVVVSGAEDLSSKRQLKEHITAASISELENYIVCLNKLDLIDKDTSMSRYLKLTQYLKNTPLEDVPIIPTSFNRGINKKWLLKYIIEKLNNPKRDLEASPLFRVTRSFDINKPGCSPKELNGGVIGGTLIRGIIKNNDVIELRPGIVKKTKEGLAYKPIITTISSIKSEENDLELAIPGGLIALGTDIDPYYTKNDIAVGNTCGHPGTLPDVYEKIQIIFEPLNDLQVSNQNNNIRMGEMLLVNCNSISIASKVIANENNEITLDLIGRLLCLNEQDTIILSRKLKEGCKIIGKGKLIGGSKAKKGF
ncbi:Hom_end-associated Hint [seawater metagenome]|uniref:protein-synthesizing GTPase n=1 Tax=seawater metagenome TaxID=1561972 RepID=A0A5E8CLR5_9ZZZZ